MRLRRAGPGDAPGITEVHVRAWKEAYPGLIPQDYLDALGVEDRLGQWDEALSGGPWPVVLVAEEGGTVLGFASIGPTRDDDLDGRRVGELQTLYLDPGRWGTGLGAQLHDEAMAELRRAGFVSASLWALDTNARARRFYERRGWTADGTTKLHDWGAFVATDVRYVLGLADGPELA